MLANTDDVTDVDAIEILSADHAHVGRLFAEFFAARSEASRRAALGVLCAALRIHIALEADVFYPRFLDATADALSHFVAAVNRATVEKLIEEIETAGVRDPRIAARVQELSQLVAHHVEEAEGPGGLFGRARAAGIDPGPLGRVLLQRRAELQRLAARLSDE